MRAALLREPYGLDIVEMESPKPGPGQVLVQVKATAICGTDVGIYTGKYPARLPLIPGHESVGVVASLGPNVEGISVWDRVVLNPVTFCLRCAYCLAGKQNLCLRGGLMGRETPGTFAEFVVVEDYRCHRLPDGISFSDATTLLVLATVFAGQRLVRIRPGTSVAVIGLGVSGLLHAQLARASGACPVVGISRSRWKLDLAKHYGVEVMPASEDDVVERVKGLTGGLGPDVVIECVGKGETLRQAMEIVRPAGTVLAFGTLPRSVKDFDGYDLYYKEIVMIGTRAFSPADLDASIRAVERGVIDLSNLVTHTYPFEKLKEAFKFVDETPGQALRVVVQI